MTVEDPSVIDQFTRSKDGSVVTLDMVEIRSFGLVPEQRAQITDKINRYLEIIRTGEVHDHVPWARGLQIQVRFLCIDEPTEHPRMMELFGAASALFARQGVDFAVQVIPPEVAGLRPGWDAERARLRDRLRQAGIPDDLYEIEGVNKARPAIESYYFLTGKPTETTVGVHERGKNRTGMRFEDDTAACRWLHDELVFPDPPPPALSVEQERKCGRRTAAFRAEVAALTGRAARAGAPPVVPHLLSTGLILDHFGQESGSYLYPDGTPFQERSLPPSMLNTTDPRFPHGYHRYQVARPLRVRAGLVAPAFEQPGGGVQLKLESDFLSERPPLPTVLWLLRNGYVRRVAPGG